jgi:predicted nucleic acid-binding protein
MKVLLDSSFVIDLLYEIAEGKPGPAHDWLSKHPRAQLRVSAVTVAEVLEGADDFECVSQFLSRFRWQGLHHDHAKRIALLQANSPSRMGENDAWPAAVTLAMKGKIVAHDPKAFARLGEAYVDFRKTA